MIYTVTLNPAVDRELKVNEIEFDTVMRAIDCRVDCGGKGFNVARMLRELKTESVAMGLAGGKSGELLDQTLQSLGIKTDFVWIDGETRTNVSIVKADNSHYLKVNEPGPIISEKDIAALMQKIRSKLQPDDWWILAGSLPPGVPPDIYAKLITIIEAAGANAILDSSGEALQYGCGAKPFLVKPNLEEASQLVTSTLKNQMSNIAIANAILQMGPKNVIISLGKAGALVASGSETAIVSSPAIVERNPIGAGDAMVAGLVWGLSQNKSIREALRRGIACGAATASQNGTDMGTYNDVIELMAQVQIDDQTS